MAAPKHRLEEVGTIEVTFTDGVYALVHFDTQGRCRSVEIHKPKGEELRPRDLRIGWGEILDLARDERWRGISTMAQEADTYLAERGIDASRGQDPLSKLVRVWDAHVEELSRRKRPRRGTPSKPPGFYLDVAAVYAEAVSGGEPPTKAVWRWARRHGDRKSTPNTAAQWVANCRRIGYLTAAPGPRRAGGRLTRRARAELAHR